MTDPTELVDRYFRLAPQTDTEGHDYHGLDAIRAWRNEVPLVTYTVNEAVTRGDEQIAHAEIAGDFPGSPVTLAFHFTFSDEGFIKRLAITA